MTSFVSALLLKLAKSNVADVPNSYGKVVENSRAISCFARRSKVRVTLELLTESGLRGVSVDEVPRRSGVAKTTIYRHWPTRSDLVLEACSQMSATYEVPDTRGFEGDITVLLTSIAKLLGTARWSSVLPSIVDAAECDADLAEFK